MVSKENNKTSSPFNIGCFQFRGGIEYTLLPKLVAVYARANGLLVNYNQAEFIKNYGGSNKLEWFTELGLLSYLSLSKDKSINMLLELRFIPVNSYLKTVTQTKDPFLSLAKIGIVKDFKF